MVIGRLQKRLDESLGYHVKPRFDGTGQFRGAQTTVFFYCGTRVQYAFRQNANRVVQARENRLLVGMLDNVPEQLHVQQLHFFGAFQHDHVTQPLVHGTDDERHVFGASGAHQSPHQLHGRLAARFGRIVQTWVRERFRGRQEVGRRSELVVVRDRNQFVQVLFSHFSVLALQEFEMFSVHSDTVVRVAVSRRQNGRARRPQVTKTDLKLFFFFNRGFRPNVV